MPPRCCGLAKQEVMTNQPNILVPVFVSGSLPPTQKKTCVKEDCPHFDCYPVEMKLFCRYIGGLSAGHVSYSLGRLKYIAIYRIHSAGSNIYRNISDAIDFKSNNNFHRSKLSIIFHFWFLLANQLEPQNNISQVIINQPLSCKHPWRKKSFVEPKAVLGSVKSSSWKFFNFWVSGENRRIILHFNKALRHSNEH